jgi:hypothetical protein
MLGDSMNGSTFTPPASSSSSSQSLNTFGPITGYSYQMPQYPSSNVMDGQGSMVESEADGMGESVEDDDERDESRDSRGSSRDTRDGGLDKRKPRVTLPRGGACVVCRYVLQHHSGFSTDFKKSEIVSPMRYQAWPI